MLRVLALGLGTAALALAASCAPSSTTNPASIAVFIPGVLEGSPTYQMLDAGVRQAAGEVANTKVTTIEGNFNQAQWGEQIAALASSGEYSLIVTSNPAMPEIAAKAAEAYPKQRFLILESWSANPAYATLAYNHRELAYLHGVVAGLIAQERGLSPLAGVVAGQEYPDMLNAIVPGFTEGFQSVHPQGRVEFRVVGNWYDAAKGADLAKGLFDQGAAVLLPIAGGANQGVVTAAKAAGRSVLWYDTDGYALEAGTIVGSGVLKQDRAAYELTKAALAGTLAYGQPRVVGVADGYLSYLTEAEAWTQGLSEAGRQSFAAVVEQIRSGALVLPFPQPSR